MKSFFAWQENNGPLSAAPSTLHYRSFYYPRAKANSLWQDFSGEGVLAASDAKLPKENLPALPFPSQLQSQKEDWLHLCKKISAGLEAGKFEKIVPARFATLALSPALEAEIRRTLFARVFASRPNVKGHRFLLQSGESAFFGLSPELLFRRHRGMLYVPAIAGTRPSTQVADLLSSAKEQKEHALVVAGIVETLRALGFSPVAAKAPELLPAGRLVHLYTPIRCADRPELGSEHLLAALHPTPAISGYPKQAAMEFLYAEEGWDRGLYSAPLLIRTPQEEVCLVAIRSALLRPGHLHLFAGAGFVAGSEPEAEWEETEKKMGTALSLLFGEDK